MKTFPSHTKSLALALPLAGIIMVGCWDDDDDDNGTGPNGQFPQSTLSASASIHGYLHSLDSVSLSDSLKHWASLKKDTVGLRDSLSRVRDSLNQRDSLIQGPVTFNQLGDSLLIQGAIAGLTPGRQYAIHVHQFGNCSIPEASGDHFGSPLEGHGNPFDEVGTHHRGDLPNLQVDSMGVGHFELITGVLNLGDGTAVAPILDSATAMDTTLHSVQGRSVVVHLLQDDYITQPAGGSDGRIACGIIAMTTGNITDTIPSDTITVPADTTTVPVDSVPDFPDPIPGTPTY